MRGCLLVCLVKQMMMVADEEKNRPGNGESKPSSLKLELRVIREF